MNQKTTSSLPAMRDVENPDPHAGSVVKLCPDHQVVKFISFYTLMMNNVSGSFSKFSDVNKKTALNALKMIDIYVSKINPRMLRKSNYAQMTMAEIDQYTVVRFTLDEYLKIIGMNRNNVSADTIKRMMKAVLAILIGKISEDGKIVYKNIFMNASYDPFLEEFELKCSTDYEVLDLFFELENKIYFKHKLKYSLALDTYNNFMMYQGFLKLHNGNGRSVQESFDLSLTDLLAMMGVASDKTSKELNFARINDKYLKPGIQAINEKTDLQIQFDKIKEGRKTVGIHVICETKRSSYTASVFQEYGLPYTDQDRTMACRMMDFVTDEVYKDALLSVLSHPKQGESSRDRWNRVQDLIRMESVISLPEGTVITDEERDVLRIFQTELQYLKKVSRLSEANVAKILAWLELYKPPMVLDALNESLRMDKFSLPYIEAILQSKAARKLDVIGRI